jgi:hypothetical protein
MAKQKPDKLDKQSSPKDKKEAAPSWSATPIKPTKPVKPTREPRTIEDAAKNPKRVKKKDSEALNTPTAASLYDRTCKRGRISKDEAKKIDDFVKDNKTAREIAPILKRAVAQIEAYILKFYGISDEGPSQVGAEFLRHLRKSEHWKFLQQHYTKEELNYYETLYGKVMAQFHEDILPTEELQVLQALDAVILVNRHKKSRKSVEDRLTELNTLIEINKIEAEDNEALQEKILSWESQRQLLFSQANARTKDFTELTKKFDETIGKLKGTREQRIKNVESSRQSWTSLIKTLQDRKVREKEGRHMEMFRMATDKAEAGLREPHKYENGEVDQPLLSSEDVRVQSAEELAEEINSMDAPLLAEAQTNLTDEDSE